MKKYKRSQIIWDYIRRNPVFRAGDISVVTDIHMYCVTNYLASWEKAGYIILEQNAKNIRDKIYRLQKKSVRAPARGKDGRAKDRYKPKEKKVFKYLQTAEQRAEIRYTHEQVETKKQPAKSANFKGVKLMSTMLKGKRADYSPTIYYVNDTGKIVCRATGWITDELKLQTGDSYGFTCTKKSA
ncbi:MAG: hypothetical protein LBL65_05735 [Campylobacteraceae bacterium]|jgi:hypothetical protein|nr:hypothetical protein [Campylobacteraceae bacterium]